MDVPDKLKLALDETRMLVLGAQVLLGFQLRSAFQERFEKLTPHAKALDATSLLLMVLVIGLLVTPALENGNATTRTMRAVGVLMALALLPFAMSLGFNVAARHCKVPGTSSGGQSCSSWKRSIGAAGAPGCRRRAVSKQVALAFLDAIFHVATLAINVLVKSLR
jgi:hypothetical protein